MKQLFNKTIATLTIVFALFFVTNTNFKATIKETVLDFTIDPVWSKLYGGVSSDQLRSLAPTSDGGFVGAGYTYNGASMGGFSYGDYDALLVKYNKYGDPEFSSEYGGNLADTFYSINQTSDGGYITCGYTQSDKSGTITTDLLGDDDGLLVKFSPTGSVEWERRFGTTGAKWQNYTSCRNITENHDGTYTMVGYHFGNNNGDIMDPNNGARDGYISKVAQNGDILWTQVFGGSANDSFNAAYELPDGSFIVAGQSQSSKSGEITATNKGNYDALIAKFDKDGNPLWHHLYGGSGSENFEALSVNDAGEVVVVGSTNSKDGDFLTAGNVAYGGVDGLIGKFDADGHVLWHETIGGSGDDYIYSVIDTKEDKYLLSGTSKSSKSGTISDANNGSTDGLVIAINEDGTLDWNHLFGGTGDDTFEDSVTVDNGSGYVVGGYSSSSNSGNITDGNSGIDDTLLVKFSTNNIPTLVVPKFVEINVGDDYDPLLNVSATDYEDGDITSSIDVTNRVDSKFPGVYITDYEVMDLERNIQTDKQIVLVNDGTYEYDDKYIIHADNVTHKIAQVRTDDPSILDDANVKVYDKTTGLEITDPTITVNKGDYQPVNGEYPITFTFDGLSITSTFTVDNGKYPQINSDSFYTSNLGDNFDIASKVSVTDEEDGPITKYTIDDSKLDINTTGAYPIEVKAVDSDGNETIKIIDVAVIDDTATVTDDFIFYNIDYTHRVGAYTLDKDYHITNSELRVYRKATAELVANDDIVINFNDYQQKAGTYNLDFSVTGTPEQFTTSEVVVTAGESPVITGPDYLEVTQGEPYVDPYGGISISDKEDDVIANSEMTSDITIDTNKPGVYIITYTIVDSDLNQDTFTQTVVVKNDKMVIDDNYIIYAEDYQVRTSLVSNDPADIANLSKLQIYDKTTNTLLEPSAATIDSSALLAEPGTYPVKISIDGLERTINVTVTKGAKPTITGTDYFEVNTGSTTDFTTSLVVKDTEDTELSKADLAVTGTVDINKPGVYELEYTVTDSDDNETSFKQQIVVKSDNTTINDQFVIFGDDYQIYVRQIDQTIDQIITRSNLKIYDKINRTYIDNPIVNIDASAIEGKAGVYPLIITYGGLDHQINVTVISGDKPVIAGANYLELDKGADFDPLAGVTLSDTEDKDLTPEMITINGTVDVDAPAVYTLEYTYTDSDNNTTSVTRIVVVKSDNMLINDDYIIYADDVTHKIADVRIDDPSIIADANVRVYDKTTGLEITDPAITVNKGDYQAANGVYPITFSYDGYDITSTFTVDNGQIPVITGEDFYTSNLGDAFDIKRKITVTDDEDGPITTYTVDDSRLDTDTLGVYSIDITAVDSDGNEVSKTIIVAIVDDTTTITDQYVFYNVDYTHRVGEYTLDKDYHLTHSGIKIYNKGTAELVANDDIMINFNDYQQKVGIYDVDFAVKDKPGQFVTSAVEVTAGDSPVITGPEYLEINQGDPYVDPYGGISISDKEDDVIANSEMTSDITVDTNKPGVYIVTYTVSDSDFNQDTFTQTVVVKNDKMVIDDNYIIYGVDYQLRVGQVTHDPADIANLSKLQVYDKATNTLLDPSAATIDSSALLAEPGTYPVKISIDGLERTINVTVTAGSKPTITGTDYFEVNTGSTTDFAASLNVADIEDTDLSKADLAVTGTVDTSKPGVYELEYTVTDSDNNETSFKQQIVVKADNTTITDQYVIFGDNYQIYTGQVPQTDDQIIELGNVKIYDKVNRTYIDITTADIDASAVKADDGRYPVTITYDGVTHQITVTVISGDKPVIAGANYLELDKGADFDPLAGVTLSDTEDKDLTPEMITINGTVDVDTPAVYTLEYTYTDSDNNTTSVTRIVVVKSDNMLINDDYIIYADDVTHKIADVRIDDPSIIADANVRVYDKTTGLEITDPAITVNKGDYQAANGVYPITFSYDGYDITSTFTVDNGQIPVITGEDFYTSNLGDAFDIKRKITVTDDEDGPITTYTVDDSRLDISTLGVYSIDITAVDSDGNEVNKTIIVAIVDDTTTITDQYVFYNVDYTHRVGEYTLDKDYHLTNSGIKIYNKGTAELVANDDIMINFNDYQQKVGIYDVDFAVKDKPGQFVTSAVEVTAGDSPVITGPEYLEINQGDPYVDPYGGISVSDKEDDPVANSEMTSDITIDTNKPGIYIITYSFIDSDLNQATFTQTVVVKNDKMVIDDNYIIYGVDYQLRVGQVTHDPADIANLSKLQVYDKATNTLLDPSAATIDSSALLAEPGTYPVKISIDGLERTINVTVTAGSKPTITGTDYFEINKGTATDFTTSLVVKDTEDTDLSKADLAVTGTVDINKPGVYELEYTVTDSDNNETSFKQQIVVKADNTTINDKYVIFGDDYEIAVSQVPQTDEQIIELSNLKIYDKVNRTYIDNPLVNIDASAVKAKAGVYPVIITYKGLSHQINVTVISGDKPVIDGANYLEIDKGTNFDPLAGVTLSDTEDKDLTPEMITVDGTVDINKPGVYNLVYTYTDSDNNTTTVNRMVVVKDENMVINDNYIISAHDYTVMVSELDLSNKAVSTLSGLTVYNKIANEYITNPNVVIDTSKVKPRAGVYEVTITYMGLVRRINITVEAGDKPVISGEDFTVITKGSSFDPLLGMSVTDKEDGPLKPSSLNVSGTVNTSKPGVYQLIYSYTDRDQNKVTFTREVVVTNKDTQITDDYIIYAHDYTTLVSKASTSSNFILSNSDAYVYDRHTKSYLTLNQIDIERGLLANKVGTYQVMIGKGDSKKPITVTVSAGTKPQINVIDKVVEVNLGDKVDFQQLITYKDLETAHSELDFKYQTNYDPNRVGVYEVNYTVTDLDGNIQTARVTIFVNDGTYVTNNKNSLGAKDVTYNLNNEQSLEQYIRENANIHAYDFNLGTEIDLTGLKIDLSQVKNQPGKYPVYLSINGLTKTIYVTITKDAVEKSETEKSEAENSEAENSEAENSETENSEAPDKEEKYLQITGNRLLILNILILTAASICIVIIKRRIN